MTADKRHDRNELAATQVALDEVRTERDRLKRQVETLTAITSELSILTGCASPDSSAELDQVRLAYAERDRLTTQGKMLITAVRALRDEAVYAMHSVAEQDNDGWHDAQADAYDTVLELPALAALLPSEESR
jgi:hypothetical protein